MSDPSTTGTEQQRRSELPGAGLLESTDLDFGGTTENVIEPVVVECPLASEGLTSYSVRIQYRAVVERERRGAAGIRGGTLAHKLDKMDPDDLAADGGRSP